jgi:broad specificity phosphatase PhoE
MKIYLIRHGETEGNVKHILAGQSESPLTQKGLEQAKKLSNRLKDKKIDIVFSSPLSRAQDTAKEILRNHPDTEYILDDRIMERSFGLYEGKARLENWDWLNLPKGVETSKEFSLRVKSFIKEITEKHGNKNILISCHAGAKINILPILTKQPIGYWVNVLIPNTSFSEFELLEDGTYKIHTLNCAKHLD